MQQEKTFKDWSKDKISKYLTWIIIAILSVNITITLINSFFHYQSDIIFYGGILRIILFSAILYAILKKQTWIFYGVAFLSLNSMKSAIKGIVADDLWSVFDLVIEILLIVLSLIILIRTRLKRNKIIISLKNLNKKEIIFLGSSNFHNFRYKLLINHCYIFFSTIWLFTRTRKNIIRTV